MFYVYSGYIGVDNCELEDGPIYKVNEFDSEQEVVEYYEEFMECVYDECAYVIFRVFEGTERLIKPKKVPTVFELS